jgi:hypothetical protein
MTPLDKSLKRALSINGRAYVVNLTPDAIKVTEKGHRLGVELKWVDLISGDSALAVALHASLGKFQDSDRAVDRKPSTPLRPPGKARKSAGKTRRVPRKSVAPKRSR